MNKLVKVISILLITVLLLGVTCQTVFAGDKETVISDLDSASYNSDKASSVKKIAKDVLGAIRTIAIIIAVVMISVLGVKYMIGSAEEKANYKKSFIPLIVGAILVVGAAQLATMLFSISVT